MQYFLAVRESVCEKKKMSAQLEVAEIAHAYAQNLRNEAYENILPLKLLFSN